MTTFISTITCLIGCVNAGTVKRFVNYSSMARYGAGHEKDDGTVMGAPFTEEDDAGGDDDAFFVNLPSARSTSHSIHQINRP